MAVQFDTATVTTGSRRWGKLKMWLAAFEEATAYDPHVHAAETIRQLRVSVKSLEARMTELEGPKLT